jgi:N-acylglucosamine 2-epimerase
MKFSQYADLYRHNLLNDVLPFWLRHSRDAVYGGYYTCLNRDGSVFDTDKFVWLQARQVWTFSMLCNKIEMRSEWLDCALLGAGFLEKYGRDKNGDWYFSLTREGKPLMQPYNIFSDCFATIAFGQLYKATGIERYKDITLQTFERILQRYDRPKGKYTKAIGGTRPLLGLSLPMILSNLIVEIEHVLPPETVDANMDKCVATVMGKFFDKSSGLVFENVSPEGEFSNSFEGRLVMPGHSLESMWFLMQIAVKKNDRALLKKLIDIAVNIMDYGWDKEHGGIFYMMDFKGYPPQQLEWDQKLWWVHMEAIVAMVKGFQYSGDLRCWEWFKKLHDYTWSHFPDPEFGEWYGYLNRRGELLLPLKGGKWKGCFHVPRCLYEGWKTLETIAALSSSFP